MAGKRKTPLLKAVRIVLSCSVFVMFVLLFADWGGVFDKALGWLPKLQFWPSVMAVNVGVLVLILAVTMVFGRWYCSILCPLGILQDGIYRLRIAGARKRRFRQGWSKAKNWLRYGILAIYLILIALGFGTMAHLLEPYSDFGAMMGTVKGVVPLEIMLVSAATLAVIVILVWKGGRTWCNTVCPVGSILSIFSARSLFRPVIDTDKCISCGVCGKACRASCIDTDNHKVDMSRCVLCMDCLQNCNEGAIEYKFVLPAVKSGSGLSRRAFMTATAVAAGTAVVKANEAHGGLMPLSERKNPERRTPVVPVGASSVKAFYDHCIGCQLCVSVCPNKVLHPTVDFDNFMKPVMDFEAGFCRPECTACADVCPAGAIKKLSEVEKSSVSIGHAEYNPVLCVVNTDGVSCGNCARHCPTGAIVMVNSVPGDDSSGKIPSVDASRCIGCGHCEYVCPSRPVSAIHVEGNQEHHLI